MMMHIDVSSVLRQTLSCELYSNLVTRPTGAAVRTQIEALLADSRERTLTIIDFSHVGMIDFSCADEVVAKLLLRYVAERDDREAYFLFRGVTDDHWDAIEAVLERHRLALVLEAADGAGAHIGGIVDDRERAAWNAVYRLGRTAPADLASALGSPADDCAQVLDSLHRRRLLMRLDDDYVAVGGLANASA